MNRPCFNCGESVSEQDYEYIGTQRVFTCGATACQKEITDANRAAQEEAAWNAHEDGYSRYWP